MRCWISEPRTLRIEGPRAGRPAELHGRERAQLAHLKRLHLQIDVGDLLP